MKADKTTPEEQNRVWIWLEDLERFEPQNEELVETRHEFYEFCLLEDGQGSNHVDFAEFPVQPYSCYVLLPQQYHYAQINTPSKGYIIRFYKESIFSKQLSAMLLNLSFTAKHPAIFENDFDKFSESMHMLKYLKFVLDKYPEKTNPIIIHAFTAFMIFVLELGGLCPEKFESASDTGLIIRFLQLVEDNFSAYHLVKDYAENLSTSERKIAAATQFHLGLTPLQVIHNRIVLQAKRLLHFEKYSQKEIAFKLGFDSSTSYTHFIKSKTGLSPTDLKREVEKIIKL